MYIDSTAGRQSASDLVVAKELQDNVEPLLLVSIHPHSISFCYVFPSFLPLSHAAIQS